MDPFGYCFVLIFVTNVFFRKSKNLLELFFEIVKGHHNFRGSLTYVVLLDCAYQIGDSLIVFLEDKVFVGGISFISLPFVLNGFKGFHGRNLVVEVFDLRADGGLQLPQIVRFHVEHQRNQPQVEDVAEAEGQRPFLDALDECLELHPEASHFYLFVGSQAGISVLLINVGIGTLLLQTQLGPLPFVFMFHTRDYSALVLFDLGGYINDFGSEFSGST